MFIKGGSAPRSNPLLLYIPFLTEKVPLGKFQPEKRLPKILGDLFRLKMAN